MEKSSTIFLRLVIIGIAIAVAAVCIFVLPAAILSDKTGYYVPVLLGMYVPAVPFFAALFQAFKLLNFIDQNKAFSEASVKSLKVIKYCGLAISASYVGLMPFIFVAAELDDAPGVILVGLVFIFASFVVATFAGVLQKLLQNALELKSENDLTV